MRTCNNRDLRGKGEREMRKEEGIPPPRRLFGDVRSAQKVTRPQAEYPRPAGGRPYGRRGNTRAHDVRPHGIVSKYHYHIF